MVYGNEFAPYFVRKKTIKNKQKNHFYPVWYVDSTAQEGVWVWGWEGSVFAVDWFQLLSPTDAEDVLEGMQAANCKLDLWPSWLVKKWKKLGAIAGRVVNASL